MSQFANAKNRTRSISTQRPLIERAFQRLLSLDRHSATRFTLLVMLLTMCNGRVVADEVVVDSVLLRLIEEADVPARQAGVLQSVKVVEGQMVSKDQVLAKIDDSDVKLAVDRAELELAVAEKKANNDVKVRLFKKALEVAKSDLRRAKESLERYPKSISDTEMDQLKLAVEKANLDIEQAEHERELAKVTVQLRENEHKLAVDKMLQRQILSPFDGVIGQLVGRRGEWVEPGEKVLRVLRLDRLKAEGFVAADRLDKNAVGRKVTLRIDSENHRQASYHGEVVFVSPEIDPVNRQVRFWAEIRNRQLRLRPGLQGRLTVTSSQSTEPDLSAR